MKFAIQSTLCLSVACCISAVSLGQRSDDLDAITDGRGMLVTGVALRGGKFSGVNFSKATFDGATLDHVIFDDCSFAGASFRNANLKGMAIRNSCDFRNATLDNALINGTVQLQSNHPNPEVGELLLTIQQLKSTLSYKEKNLSNCLITGQLEADKDISLDLRGFNLRGAQFNLGNFFHCQLEDAEIQGAEFLTGRISWEQIESTKTYQEKSLQGVQLWKNSLVGKADYSGCTLRDARLNAVVPLSLDSWPKAEHRAAFEDANIEGSFLVGMNFDQLAQTRDFKSRIVLNVHFGKADFSNADLSGVNFTGCKFSICNFTGANLSDAVLSKVSFRGATKGLTPQQIKQTWTYKHGRIKDVEFRNP